MEPSAVFMACYCRYGQKPLNKKSGNSYWPFLNRHTVTNTRYISHVVLGDSLQTQKIYPWTSPGSRAPGEESFPYGEASSTGRFLHCGKQRVPFQVTFNSVGEI